MTSPDKALAQHTLHELQRAMGGIAMTLTVRAVCGLDVLLPYLAGQGGRRVAGVTPGELLGLFRRHRRPRHRRPAIINVDLP